MKIKISITMLLFTTIAISFPVAGVHANDKEPPATVPHVDLERYAGLWYEIAKIPNRFQKKCAGAASAFYSIREDGRIDVVNSCVKENGDRYEAKGVAKVEDSETNSKLKVSFVRFLGKSLFWGNYWIIGLGDDYEYAIIGTPDRKYGWILSRKKQMDPAQLQEITEQLSEQGYNPQDFEMTRH
jgi:apolipoprotein D and lipocalin family protein